MSVKENHYYTKEHEWVKVDGRTAIFGISDYAQHSLGDITYVELPKIGSVCKQFSEIASIESVKAASSVYAPLSGKITKINTDLESRPELVNSSPYEEGYFAVMEIDKEEELKDLMDSKSYEAYLEEKK